MERQKVKSSNIYSVGYDESSETLEIEFNTGDIYQYYGVSKGVYDDLLQADSLGGFHARNIKNDYRYLKI